MEDGDVLLLFTDGIPECRSHDGTFFGSERVLEVARSHLQAPAYALVHRIGRAVREFGGGLAQRDDSSLVVCKRVPT